MSRQSVIGPPASDITLTRAERRRTTRMVARILARWQATNGADLARGTLWYSRARQRIRRIADRHSVEPATVAGVIAALSPRSRWRLSVEGARRMLDEAGRADGVAPALSFGRARRQAWAIARGASPGDTLTGLKVRDFYRALIGDTSAVPVDSWLTLAALGRPSRRGPDGRLYAMIVSAYRQAARLAGRPSRDFAAVIWVSVRGSAS